MAIGPVFVLSDATRDTAARTSDPDAELRRIDKAVACAQAQLDELRGGLEREAGEDAAALISDELARMADFLSIGTNDLTQYALAQDREGEGTCSRPCHPAVLKLIQMTAENAHAAGIPVSICGELAADPELSDTFLGFRIDSLSV